MARKKTYKPKRFESTGVSNDTSANIYESMLLSPAFMDLNSRTRTLYLYMKAQYYGKRKPGKDFPDIEQVQSDECFYFNMSVAVKYKLYSVNNHTQFYNDIKILENHGFIKTISNGKATRSKSIYRFSDEWQEWKN